MIWTRSHSGFGSGDQRVFELDPEAFSGGAKLSTIASYVDNYYAESFEIFALHSKSAVIQESVKRMPGATLFPLPNEPHV